MAKTTAMRLLELMVLKEDISRVIEYLGKNGNFEFQSGMADRQSTEQNAAQEMFEKLQSLRTYLNIEDADDYDGSSHLPEQADIDAAHAVSAAVEELRQKELAVSESKKRVDDAYKEALAFSNLKVS